VVAKNERARRNDRGCRQPPDKPHLAPAGLAGDQHVGTFSQFSARRPDLRRGRYAATRQHFGRRSRADGPNRFSALDDVFARCGFNKNLDAASPRDPTSSSNRPHYESIGYCVGVHPSHRQVYATRLVGYHTTELRLADAGPRVLHCPAIPALPQTSDRLKSDGCDRNCDDGRDPHYDDARHAPRGPRRDRRPLMMPCEAALRRASLLPRCPGCPDPRRPSIGQPAPRRGPWKIGGIRGAGGSDCLRGSSAAGGLPSKSHHSRGRRPAEPSGTSALAPGT
jgi:hypothetical protein